MLIRFRAIWKSINLREFGGRPAKSCTLLVFGIAALVIRKLGFDMR